MKENLQRNEILNFDYVRLSDKYSRYFESALNKKNRDLISLIGPAGSGKSAIYENDFLRLVDQKNIFFEKHFSQNQLIGNASFVKDLASLLLQNLKKYFSIQRNQDLYELLNLSEQDIHSLEKIVSSNSSRKTNIVSFDKYNFHPIFNLLNSLSNVKSFDKKIILSFEDCHYAEEYFHRFLKSFFENVHLENYLVFIVSRENIGNISTKNFSNKIFNLNNLSISACDTLITNICGSQYGIDIEEIYTLTKGNPFLLKQAVLSYFFDNQNTPLEKQKVSSDSIILHRRFFGLSEKLQNALKACYVLGFSFSLEELRFIYGDDQVILELSDELVNQHFIFLKDKKNNIFSFHHSIFYDFLRECLTSQESIFLHKKAYRYFKSKQDFTNENLVKLAFHAEESKLYAYSFYYYYNLAENFFDQSDFVISNNFYKKCLDSSKKIFFKKSSKSKKFETLVQYIKTLNLIGQYHKADEYASYLLEDKDNFDVRQRLSIYSRVALAKSNLGHLEEAKNISKECIKLARESNQRGFEISFLSRYSSICAEQGDHSSSIKFDLKALSLIRGDEHREKFNMFVSMYPAIQSNLAKSYIELNDYKKAISHGQKSLEGLGENYEDFTKLYLIVQASHAYLNAGKFHDILPYLKEGRDLYKKTNAHILGPICLSSYGFCLVNLGHIQDGSEYIYSAKSIIDENVQGHKTGIIILHLLETLLFQFKLNEFDKIFDSELDNLKKTEQLGSVAWMYYLKAARILLYSSDYTSLYGYIAKSEKIAQKLNLKLLQSNLKALSLKTPIFSNEAFTSESSNDLMLFNKTNMLFDRASNLKSVN